MKKILILLFIAMLGIKPAVKADEGMWLPLFVERLNYVDMEKMGLHLTAEEIYSINNSSLKDAIIIFGRGCTGEIVSDQGLIFTNHHCGYPNIQAHSTTEHDYLTDGFWAMNKKEELPNEGLTAQFLVRVEDVTETILAGLTDDMPENERVKKAYEIGKELTDKAIEGTSHNGYVKSFFDGNEYYMFIYETFKDIRLVGAPPSSIGKFGADTDNWMWPRHTADFSIFRVYTAPDGSPAEYSENNVPLKPKHHLPVSIKGVEKDDFAMIMGYPGGTDRFLTSYGVDLAIEESNPTIVKIRDKKLSLMREDMNSSDEIRIKYASKYAQTANYWKYFIGQTKGLKRLKVSDKKREIENNFREWTNADQKRKAEFTEALTDIEDAYNGIKSVNLETIYFSESIRRGSEVIGMSYKFASLKKELKSKDADQEKIDAQVEHLKEAAKGYFKDYNAPTDEKLLGAMLEMFYNNVPTNQHPEYLTKIAKKYKNDFNKLAKDVFAKTIFADEQKLNDFFANPKAKAIEKDPAYMLMKAFYNNHSKVSQTTKDSYNLLARGNRLFVKGLRMMNPDKKYYPNANFTMRLTYGQVLDYYPADAVHYNYFTTLKGVMEKEDPNNWEFVVPAKLKELYKAKDYGRYGENGVMKTCFLTNHDITGGNSGSPVINADGELIGLAFDGNWEAMSGDIAFEPELQRTICVDARYVLFIIDKFAGATNIIEELDIVEKPIKKLDTPEAELIEKTAEPTETEK